MRDLSFSNMNEEKANNYKIMLSWCKSDVEDNANLRIYFKNKDGNFKNGKFCEIAKKANAKYKYSLESVLVLAHFLFLYTKKHPRFLSEQYEYETKVLEYEFGQIPTIGELTESLVHLEKFLAEIVYLIHPEEFEKAMSKSKFGLDDIMSFQRRIDDKFGLFDESLFSVSEIAYTLRKFRNDQHPFKNPDFLIPTGFGSGETLRNIRNSITSFILLVVWYRYDDIYTALERNGAFNPEDVAIAGADILERYVGKLRNKQLSIINDNIYKSTETNSLEQIIDVKLKHYQNNADGANDNDDSYINANELLYDQNEHFSLLAGESGSGKTTMLAYMIYKAITDWMQDKENKPLPIKIELDRITSEVDLFNYIIHEIAKKEGMNTDDKTQHQKDVKEINAIRTYLRKIFNEGRCLLFIEGLNEIVQKDQSGNNVSFELRTQVINDILEFSLNFNKVRYFVTTRISGIFTNERGTIGQFKRYDLQPLDDLQILTQINNYNSIVSNSHTHQEYISKDLWNSIRNHKIGELAQNPMQLMQIVELFGKNGIKEEDYNIPISELYRKLIEERLINKANFLLPEVNDKNILVLLINNLLRNIAKELFENQCRSVDYERILARKDDIITNSSSITIEDLLRVATSLFILKKENDEYSFSHDSWQEYYLAFDFAQQVKCCKDDDVKLRSAIEQFGNKPEDFQKQDMMDILRETFEILENEWLSGSRKERDENIKTCINRIKEIKLEDIGNEYNPEEIKKQNELNELYDKIKKYNKDYAEKTNDSRRRMSKLAKTFLSLGDSLGEWKQLTLTNNDFTITTTEGTILPKVNILLPVLAYATTTITDETFNNDISIPGNNCLNIQPKEIVRQFVTAQLAIFKKTHEEGFSNTEPDVITAQVNDILKPIFLCIALLNDEKLIEAILMPYWFRLWVMRPEDEMKIYEKVWKRTNALNVVPGVLIEHNTNLLLLYRHLYEKYKQIVIMSLSDTALQIERMMMRILLLLKDEQILNVIDTLTHQKVDEIEQIINRRLCANALLVLNNVDIMINKLNEINRSLRKDDINFEYRFRSGIHKRAASKLITKFDNLKVQELVIGKECENDKTLIGLIEDLPMGSDVHIKVLRSVLMRYNMIAPDMLAVLEKYLASEDGRNIIGRHPDLLDLLPLDMIPQCYKSTYDQEILQIVNKKTGPYSVSKIYYQEITCHDKRAVAIPLPSTREDLNSFYIRFDGTGSIYKTQCIDMCMEEQAKYSNRPILVIEKIPDNGMQEGYVEIFSDEDGIYTKNISFDSFIDLIRINHPERYHASICGYLVNSCNIKRDIKDIFLFCKKKSRTVDILNRYLNGEIEKWEFSIPNVCVVIETSSSQTQLFSPYKSGILNKFDPRQYRTGSFFSNYPSSLSSGIKKGDFVIYERNDMIYPLPNKLVKEKRDSVLGFVEGIFVKDKNDNLMVSVTDNLNYAFYLEKGTDASSFKKGDKVSFFPSIDYDNKKIINVALFVEKTTKD